MGETTTYARRVPKTRRGQLSNLQYQLNELMETHNLIGEDLLAGLDNLEEKVNDNLIADRQEQKDRRHKAQKPTAKK